MSPGRAWCLGVVGWTGAHVGTKDGGTAAVETITKILHVMNWTRRSQCVVEAGGDGTQEHLHSTSYDYSHQLKQNFEPTLTTDPCW